MEMTFPQSLFLFVGIAIGLLATIAWNIARIADAVEKKNRRDLRRDNGEANARPKSS